MNEDAKRLCLATITGAHGVRGLVRLRCHTDQPEQIGAHGPLADDSGRAFSLSLNGPAPGENVWLARIDGVTTREAADALKGTDLFIARDALPQSSDEEGWLYADLIGLNAVCAPTDADMEFTRGALGAVTAVHDFGAGTILEISTRDGKTVMVPFNRASVPDVDLAAGELVIDPPVGLIDPPKPPRQFRRKRKKDYRQQNQPDSSGETANDE